ncbi:MAG: type III secretion system chaperone [Rhodospirillales bacterium]|nr:type III secretion system chaperone [Rhodospirillales bacterium]
MPEQTRALYAALAKALGVESLPTDNDGAVALTIGDDQQVLLYAEAEATILVVAPVAELPARPDHGTMLWLLRRNLWDSDLAPFCVAADPGGHVLLWGRVPVDGMTGELLASLIDQLGTEAGRARDALEGTEA